jgi:hypothetical protein
MVNQAFEQQAAHPGVTQNTYIFIGFVFDAVLSCGRTATWGAITTEHHNAPTYPNLQSGAIQNVSALAPHFFEQCTTASSYTLAVGAFYPVSYLTVATVHHGEPPN